MSAPKIVWSTVRGSAKTGDVRLVETGRDGFDVSLALESMDGYDSAWGERWSMVTDLAFTRDTEEYRDAHMGLSPNRHWGVLEALVAGLYGLLVERAEQLESKRAEDAA